MRFIYTQADGTVAIVTAASKEDVEVILGPMSAARYKAHVIERSIPKDAVDVRPLPDDFEMDRYFRNAWVQDKGKVIVHMERARDIQREKLRVLRAPILAELDVQFIRAIESGDSVEQDAIVIQKQKLRDVTDHPDIEAATTPEELMLAGMSVISDGV